MNSGIRFAPLSLALAGLLLVGCGQKDERDNTSLSLTSESAQGEAAVAASFNEAMDSMSDTNMSSGSTALALADVTIDIDRSCAAVDGKAVVTINLDKTHSWDRSGERVTLSVSSTMENEIIRTWSKEGSSVGCELNGKAAAIDFEADLTGYQLDVAVKRTRDRVMERTIERTAETTTRSLKSTVDGTRHAKWLSQATLEDGSISRTKSVGFSVTRTDNFVAKDGTIKDMQLTVETKEELQVTVTWDNLTRDRQLLSKLIASGKILSTHATDSYVEASFDDLLMKFDATSCSIFSGSMEAKIYEAGSADAAKVYQLTAEAGTITVMDVTDPANPEEVEDFDYSPCDRKDFNY